MFFFSVIDFELAATTTSVLQDVDVHAAANEDSIQSLHDTLTVFENAVRVLILYQYSIKFRH